MEFAFAALVIGILGSLHCIGMCGPIALMLHARVQGQSWLHSLLYNIGRIFTYAILGAVVATLGRGLAWAGLQQIVSITTGVVILLILLLTAAGKQINWMGNWNQAIAAYVRKAMNKVLPHQSLFGFFAVGMVNGLLPCGLIYVALAGALNTSSIYQGSLFMVLFGLGTFPAMFVAGMAGKFLHAERRMKIRLALPWFTALVAIMLIIRGLDLGIPYVSPHTTNSGVVMDCCQQPGVH
jgi:sulfite exporter TauE/SafE